MKNLKPILQGRGGVRWVGVCVGHEGKGEGEGERVGMGGLWVRELLTDRNCSAM